jgi:hypothetical protein
MTARMTLHKRLVSSGFDAGVACTGQVFGGEIAVFFAYLGFVRIPIMAAGFSFFVSSWFLLFISTFTFFTHYRPGFIFIPAAFSFRDGCHTLLYMTSSGELLGGGVIYRGKVGRASPLHVIYVQIGLADDAGGNDADERPRYIYMYGWMGGRQFTTCLLMFPPWHMRQRGLVLMNVHTQYSEDDLNHNCFSAMSFPSPVVLEIWPLSN